MTSDLITALKNMMKKEISSGHTATPAKILDFNQNTCKATIKPLATDDAGEEYPSILNVPVFFPTFGGCQISFPVKKNDYCLLIYCENDLSKWSGSGDGKKRIGTGSLNNAVALIGFSNGPNTSDIQEAQNNDCIVIRGNVKVYGTVSEEK